MGDYKTRGVGEGNRTEQNDGKLGYDIPGVPQEDAVEKAKQELVSQVRVVEVDFLRDVAEFHIKFGLEYNGPPRVLPNDLFMFRSKFHREEIEEYDVEQDNIETELVVFTDEDLIDPEVIIGCLDKQIDALVDAAYVILGTAYLQFGNSRFAEAWRRAHAANMAKVRKLNVADGVETVDSGRAPKYDIVKPEGWVPPDHKDLVRDYVLPDPTDNV